MRAGRLEIKGFGLRLSYPTPPSPLPSQSLQTLTLPAVVTLADLDSQPAADYLTAGEGPHKGEETRTSENRQPGGTGGGRAVLPVTLGRSPEVHVAGPHWGHSQEEGGGPRKRPPALGIAWLSAFLLLKRAWAPQGASYKCSSDPAGLGQGLRVHF